MRLLPLSEGFDANQEIEVVYICRHAIVFLILQLDIPVVFRFSTRAGDFEAELKIDFIAHHIDHPERSSIYNVL
jgi:hypothetical protein